MWPWCGFPFPIAVSSFNFSTTSCQTGKHRKLCGSVEADEALGWKWNWDRSPWEICLVCQGQSSFGLIPLLRQCLTCSPPSWSQILRFPRWMRVKVGSATEISLLVPSHPWSAYLSNEMRTSPCYNTIWENWENLIEWNSVWLRNRIKRSSKTRRPLKFCVRVEKAELHWLIRKSSGHCCHAFRFSGYHSDITTNTSEKPGRGNVSRRSLYHLHYISDQWA